MKIRVTVEQLSVAQWDWLIKNVRQEWAFDQDAVRVCVEFAHPDEIEHRHMELEARHWIEVVSKLAGLSRVAEAVLTPDALPDEQGEKVEKSEEGDPGLKLGRIGTNSGHGHVWKRPDGMRARCGGPALCSACKVDFKLVSAL